MITHIVIMLLFIGLLLYLIEMIPVIDGTIKQLIRVVIIVGAILYVIQAFGLFGYLP